MARYIREFQLTTTPDAVFNTVHQYLISEGYEYIQYDNENVFKKGKGVWTGPTFFKLSFAGNSVRLEAWMKYALLPGVYVGELGLTGFVAAGAKGPLKKRTAQIEAIIMQYTVNPVGYSFPTQSQETQQPIYAQQVAVNQPTGDVFCKNCGSKLAQGTAFCPNCGQAVGSSAQPVQAPPQGQYAVGSQPYSPNPLMQTPMLPAGQYISKKDFRNNYVPSFKKDLRSVAILCYVCAGISAIVALAFSPLNIIDSLLLVGFALGMHLGKSKVCAILLLILGCLEVLVGIIVSSPGSGVLWLIAGIAAVVTFNKADKQYKNFISGNYYR